MLIPAEKEARVMMARITDWQREAHEALRRELWTLRGSNAIVKVVPAGSHMLPAYGGYITLGKFLIGKTPAQIVVDLGLRASDYMDGARIYRFARLPQISEYDYDLTTEFPGGLAYTTAASDPAYPSGSREIHQWKIKNGVQIPIDQTNFLDLQPGQLFPYSWL